MNRQMESAAIPCTCGELFQGVLDGTPCLVSCPIDRYSTATVSVVDTEISRLPHKACQALDYLTGRAGRKVGVTVANPLAVGRGYGTSTADIGSVLFGASQALNLHLTASEAARIAVQIEPTDSTFFPGLALFDHRQGSFFEPLGNAPPAWLVVLDPGGMVDTQAFNHKDWRASLAALSSQHHSAFRLLQQGIAAGDLAAIGEAATLSAQCHQSILFNPLLDIAMRLAKQLGAVGICRAHSGTVLGLVFREEVDVAAAVAFASCNLPPSVQVWKVELVGGGLRLNPAIANMEMDET